MGGMVRAVQAQCRRNGPFRHRQCRNRRTQTVSKQTDFVYDWIENIDGGEIPSFGAVWITDIFEGKQVLEIVEVLDGPAGEIVIG